MKSQYGWAVLASCLVSAVLFAARQDVPFIPAPKISLETHIAEVAGFPLVECGSTEKRSATPNALKKAIACARDAVKRHRAFVIVGRAPGTDSVGATGVVGRADGAVMSFSYDSAPCGGPHCAESFDTKPCLLVNLRMAPGPIGLSVTCEAPALPHRVLGTGVMSSRVVATSIVDIAAGERSARLQLLILWRGRPGWLLRNTPPQISGFLTHEIQDRRVVTTSLPYGYAELTLRYDVNSRVATIQGTRVRLDRRTNVILVDDVDRTKLRFSTTAVDGDVQAVGMGIGATAQDFIARSPELVDYLECSAAVPEALPPSLRPTIFEMCSRFR